jgi:hypothetical protein
VRRKFFAHAVGMPKGGSSERRPGSEDPHRLELKFEFVFNTTAGKLVAC